MMKGQQITNPPLTKTQSQLKEIAMSLFSIDLRRESVKAAQALGTLLGERVNKAAWKSYVPAIVDLIIAADRGDETAANKVDALLVDGITMNDIIAIGAACKVVGITGEDQVYKIVYKLGSAAQNDKEFVDRMHAAIGGYQAATAFARAAETEPVYAPTEDERAAARQNHAEYIQNARNRLTALVDATAKATKAKQLAMLSIYADTALAAVDSLDSAPFDSMAGYRAHIQVAVIAEMEAAKVPVHVIEAYKIREAQRSAGDFAVTGGYENV